MRNLKLVFLFLFVSVFTTNLKAQSIFPFSGFWNIDGTSVTEEIRLDSMSHYGDTASGMVVFDVVVFYNDDCILDSISYMSREFYNLKVSIKYAFEDDQILKKYSSINVDDTSIGSTSSEIFDYQGRLLNSQWSIESFSSFSDGRIYKKYDDFGNLVVDEYHSQGAGGTGYSSFDRISTYTFNSDGLLDFMSEYDRVTSSVSGTETKIDTLRIIYDGKLKQKESLYSYRTSIGYDFGQVDTTNRYSLYETYFKYNDDTLSQVLRERDSSQISRTTYDYMSMDTIITYHNRWEEIEWREEIRHSGNNRSYIKYESRSDSLKPEIKILQERDSSDSLTLNARYYYSDGTWKLRTKYEYLYDENGNLEQYCTTTSSVDTTLSKRTYYYAYNSENQITSESSRYFSSIDSFWVNSQTKEYFYNANNQLITRVDHYNYSQGPRIDTTQFSYNSFGLEIKREFNLNDWYRYFSDSPCYEVLSTEMIKEPATYMRVYPNPTTHGFEISLDGSIEYQNNRIALYDMGGRLLEEMAYKDMAPSMALGADLKKGCYMIVHYANGQLISSQKAIKI